jgi:hypothetical protein
VVENAHVATNLDIRVTRLGEFLPFFNQGEFFKLNNNLTFRLLCHLEIRNYFCQGLILGDLFHQKSGHPDWHLLFSSHRVSSTIKSSASVSSLYEAFMHAFRFAFLQFTKKTISSQASFFLQPLVRFFLKKVFFSPGKQKGFSFVFLVRRDFFGLSASMIRRDTFSQNLRTPHPSQGCQIVLFHTKTINLGKFGRVL